MASSAKGSIIALMAQYTTDPYRLIDHQPFSYTHFVSKVCVYNEKVGCHTAVAGTTKR